MKYYVVIDTNVLVSAMLKWDSVPGAVMSLVFDGPIIPVLNDTILKEYREVLSRPKFRFTAGIVDAVLEVFLTNGLFVDAEPQTVALPDPKDLVFYEVVMEERKTRDSYLVTGNIRHFPAEPFIVTPRQLLDHMLAEENGHT